jgi:hypothetical protein
MKVHLPAFAIAALAAWAMPASALTVNAFSQSVSVSYADANGVVQNQLTDSEVFPPGDVFTRNLSVLIGSSQFAYDAQAGATPLGLYGVAGSLRGAGTVTTSFDHVDQIENDSNVPVDIEVSMVILDGTLWHVGDQNSSTNLVVSAGGTGLMFRSAVVRLDGTPSFATLFSESGPSIGVFDGTSVVTFPFSITRFNLGTLDPGDSALFTYDFDLIVGGGITEIATWEFVDPGSVGGGGGLVSYTATPTAPVSAVPLPSAALLMLGALAALAGTRRRA